MEKREVVKKISSFLEFVSKCIFVIIIINLIVSYFISPLLLIVIHILFDNDLVYTIYEVLKANLSTLPTNVYNILFNSLPEPHTKDWGEQFSNLRQNMATTLMIKLIVGYIASLLLYAVTILFRHHYGEMAPYTNDREAKKLKKSIIKSTDSRLRDRKKNSQDKEGMTLNVFRWVFVSKVRQARRRNKPIRIMHREIRNCKVEITTTHDENQHAPVKKYKVIFRNPDNTEAGNKLFSKIKELHNKLIQFTQVTFDQYKQPKDRSIYIFEGSIEKEKVVAKSISKNNNGQKQKVEKVTYDNGEGNGNYPLTLLIDRSKDIEKETLDAENFAKENIVKIDEFLASSNIQADLSHYHVGKGIIAYYYKPRYSKDNNSIEQKKKHLTRLLANENINVSERADKLIINLPLKEKISIDNRKTIFEGVSGATNPMHAVLGIGTDNSIIHQDISDAPHMIIAGTTGSGKSVGLNYILLSISYNATPDNFELAILDPKKVEFTVYEDHPCNIVKPVDNPQDSVEFLKYATYAMEDRYDEMAKHKVKTIDTYNKKMKKLGKPIMKNLLIVIDEYADLVLVTKDVEDSVQRLVQMGRACGITIILATQRPSVDVLPGLIKANMITRIAYQVTSKTDSFVTLDKEGAEKLTGKGDSLLNWKGQEPFVRMQGGLLWEEEVIAVVDYLSNNFDKNTIVDYKARVEREEGISEETNDYNESVTALYETRQGFEESNKNNSENNHNNIVDFENKQEEKTTVSLDPENYMNQSVVNSKNIDEDEMNEKDKSILDRAFDNAEKRRKNRNKSIEMGD